MWFGTGGKDPELKAEIVAVFMREGHIICVCHRPDEPLEEVALQYLRLEPNSDKD